MTLTLQEQVTDCAEDGADLMDLKKEKDASRSRKFLLDFGIFAALVQHFVPENRPT